MSSLQQCKASSVKLKDFLRSYLKSYRGPDHNTWFGTKIEGPGLSGGPTSEGTAKPHMHPPPPAPPPPGGGAGAGGPPAPPAPSMPKIPGGAPPSGGTPGGGPAPPKQGEAGIKESKKKPNDQLDPCAGNPDAPKPCGAGPYGNKDAVQLKKNEKELMAPLGPALKMAKVNDKIKAMLDKHKKKE